MKQDCPIKDLGLQEGDDLTKGVDFDDVTLNFDCGYEILGSSQQSHPRYSNDNKELDCLVMEKNASVTGSNNVETSHEVCVTAFLIYSLAFPINRALKTAYQMQYKPDSTVDTIKATCLQIFALSMIQFWWLVLTCLQLFVFVFFGVALVIAFVLFVRQHLQCSKSIWDCSPHKCLQLQVQRIYCRQ